MVGRGGEKLRNLERRQHEKHINYLQYRSDGDPHSHADKYPDTVRTDGKHHSDSHWRNESFGMHRRFLYVGCRRWSEQLYSCGRIVLAGNRRRGITDLRHIYQCNADLFVFRTLLPRDVFKRVHVRTDKASVGLCVTSSAEQTDCFLGHPT